MTRSHFDAIIDDTLKAMSSQQTKMIADETRRIVPIRSFFVLVPGLRIAFCLWLLAGAGSVFSQVQTSDPALSQGEPEYRIHSGDQLDVKFYYHPELNESVTVRPDGRISLQMAYDVTASGLTSRQLADKLTALYSVDLKLVDATVIVKTFSAQRIFVDGEVGRPGVVGMPGKMTLLQALAESGGLKETASVKNIIVVRVRNGKAQPFRMNVLYESGEAAAEIDLQPLDLIYVPRSRIANVNRWVDQYIRKNIPITFGILSNALLP